MGDPVCVCKCKYIHIHIYAAEEAELIGFSLLWVRLARYLPVAQESCRALGVKSWRRILVKDSVSGLFPRSESHFFLCLRKDYFFFKLKHDLFTLEHVKFLERIGTHHVSQRD